MTYLTISEIIIRAQDRCYPRHRYIRKAAETPVRFTIAAGCVIIYNVLSECAAIERLEKKIVTIIIPRVAKELIYENAIPFIR